VIGWIAILLLACALVELRWRLIQRARTNRKRRRHRLEIELRLADAFEAFHQEVFRLKHYQVLRPNASRRNAGLIPSTNVSSLRYIKGRQNED
jgi:hypothetical protein